MSWINFQLNIGCIKIGSIENASSLNIGRNYLRDFNNSTKTNQGFGSISGDHNSLNDYNSYVEDPDGIDLLVRDSD